MTTSPQQAMVALFQRHMAAEIAGDLDTTMATMADGVGREGVRADHLIGQFFSLDLQVTPASRTVGHETVVEELVLRFTHTAPLDFILPGVPPTGKPVEMAVVVIVGFKEGKISHEHIYWDQASVLVQIGLLDPAGLP